MILTRSEVDAVFQVPFSFRQRPRPSPADARPLWRIPYVLLLVRACRQRQARLEQLHVLNWVLRTSDASDTLESLLTGDIPIDRAIVRYEPALDRAISLATGLEFLRFNNKSWRLTETATAVLDAVDADDDLFTREKRLLETLSAPVTQAAIARLFRRSRRDI